MGKTITELAEEILKDFEFEEVLEMNDLSHEDLLEMLIENGMILEPERYFP